MSLLLGCPGHGQTDDSAATATDTDTDTDADADADADADTDTDTSTADPVCPDGVFADPVARALPTTWGTDAFARDPTDTARCSSGQDVPAWTRYDLDGDGYQDLVITADCEDAAVGTSSWRVSRGGAAGFAEPATWSLPSMPTGSFLAPSGGDATCSTTGLPAWTTLDLTGDARPDLVVTTDCADASVGTSSWKVYINNGAGFSASSATWRLPSGWGAAAFPETSVTSEDCDTPGPAFFVADLSGAGRPQLVLTDDCGDDTIGSSAWTTFPNSGTSFATSGQAWALPFGFSDGAFQRSYGPTLSCDGGNDWPLWFLDDVDGDARADIVVVSSCIESDLGSTDWRVFLNEGAGFSAAGGRWTLPTGYPDGAFAAGAVEEADCGTGTPAWFLDDLTGDHQPDIVVTAVCDAPEVGGTEWRVYENAGARFDTSRVAWTLPGGYTAGAFGHRSAATPTCDGSDTWPGWQLLDLAGDGQNDIVILDDCADAGVGTLTWLEAVGSCG